MAPRLLLGAAVLALMLAIASPASATPLAAGPLVCVQQHCRGYLSVPLDRTGFVPGHVELYISEFLPDGPSKGVVFLLAGGPGQSSSYVWDAPDSVWEGYTQIVYDDRGTGQSSRIGCGPFVGDDPRADVVRCNDLLGAQRAFYSTRDNAADMDAIRRALGFDKVAVWGTSYGTKQALAYAQAYPTHVERLLLDSTLLPTGPDVYNLQYGQSVPLGLKSLCAGGICARATPDMAADVAAVANALAAKPIDGTIKIEQQSATPVRLTGYDVVALAISTDVGTTLSNLLPSAVRAAHEGRPAELERLWALATWGSRDAPDHTDYFSEPVFAATTCDDGEFPWPAGTPVAARQPFVDRALAALPASAFGAFGPWIAASGLASTCLGWESTGLSPLGTSGLPDVPTLVVSGDRDIRTPTSNARAVAALFPRSSVLVVHGTGHSVVGSEVCADEAVGTWLDGAKPPAECVSDEAHFVLPLVPGSVASVTALPPGGKVGKTLAAVVATVDELFTYERLAESEKQDDVTLAGLVAGSSDVEEMHAYSDVPGLTLSGAAPIFGRATFTVGGSAAVHGKLRFEQTGPRGECRITGTLGSKRVSARC
jgi:pimeloyl-ACP methyl ester carboxylesterase